MLRATLTVSNARPCKAKQAWLEKDQRAYNSANLTKGYAKNGPPAQVAEYMQRSDVIPIADKNTTHEKIWKRRAANLSRRGCATPWCDETSTMMWGSLEFRFGCRPSYFISTLLGLVRDV